MQPTLLSNKRYTKFVRQSREASKITLIDAITCNDSIEFGFVNNGFRLLSTPGCPVLRGFIEEKVSSMLWRTRLTQSAHAAVQHVGNGVAIFKEPHHTAHERFS